MRDLRVKKDGTGCWQPQSKTRALMHQPSLAAGSAVRNEAFAMGLACHTVGEAIVLELCVGQQAFSVVLHGRSYTTRATLLLHLKPPGTFRERRLPYVE
jgi:hypothetical protein